MEISQAGTHPDLNLQREDTLPGNRLASPPIASATARIREGGVMASRHDASAAGVRQDGDR